jgi:exonuclease III
VSVYVPNSGRELKRLDYRVKKWDLAFKNYLDELKNNNIIITYNDYSKEKLPTIGLRNSHRQAMFETLKQEIELSNLNRDF